MYHQSLDPAAREQNQSVHKDEHNPRAALERQLTDSEWSMNPVRKRISSGRHQEDSQLRRPQHASTSQHGQQMRGSNRHEESSPVPFDVQPLYEEHHHQLKCCVCFEEAVDPKTNTCGHTFCSTCHSQHWRGHKTSIFICPICLMQGSYTNTDCSFPLPCIWESPLLFADHAGNIKLNMAVVENYFMSETIRDIPVYLLCVVGEKRTGKSFLMNYIIRALRNQAEGTEFSLGKENETLKGFELKSGVSGTTKGVWIWREPFIVERDGKKMALFLLDSEELMDIEKDRNTSIKLFSSAMLLSTHVIYNVSKRIDEKEVEIYLHEAAQGPTQNKKYLDIVVRDWQDYEDCRSETAELYLKKQAETLKKRNSTVLNPLENPNTKCFLMPHPGKEIGNSDKGRLKDMDKDFRDCLTSYIKDLLERPKFPAMTGAQMAEMMKGTIGHFQSLKYNFSSPQEMSYYIHNHGEMQKTCTEFKQFLLSLSSLQLPETMWECISEKSLKLVKQFEQSFRGNNVTIRTDLVEQLRTTLKEEGEKFNSDYKQKEITYASSASTFGNTAAAGGGGRMSAGGGRMSAGGGRMSAGGGRMSAGGGRMSDGGGRMSDGGGRMSAGGGTMSAGGGMFERAIEKILGVAAAIAVAAIILMR
ncbi:RING finger protein 112 [Xenopus laevis]|uniref:RING-type domain-containing protein n=2 Tax=Xenopus laevis TaxID=8355 RepID=A0A974HTT5_XENLA|nr:RING finger protein 112 [Xenopus laevis]OCT90182.1 hypothetical protein XELAEV_18018794mg [Xenopus laevis]